MLILYTWKCPYFSWLLYFLCSMKFGHLVVLHILCPLNIGFLTFFFHVGLCENLFQVDFISLSIQQSNQLINDFTLTNINEPWPYKLPSEVLWAETHVQSVRDCSQLGLLVKTFKVKSFLINTECKKTKKDNVFSL